MLTDIGILFLQPPTLRVRYSFTLFHTLLCDNLISLILRNTKLSIMFVI